MQRHRFSQSCLNDYSIAHVRFLTGVLVLIVYKGGIASLQKSIEGKVKIALNLDLGKFC